MVAIEIKGENNEQLKKVQFASCFTIDEISHQPGGQISWRTIIEIMQKSKTHEEMLYYISETHKNGCYKN